MKVALSMKDNQVTAHFGHCDIFVIYEISNGQIMNQEIVKNPPHQKGFLPMFLKNLGIDVVIAGGIGKMAVDLLKQVDIEVYLGVTGEAEDVIKKYLNNELDSVGEPCTDHHH